jgi:hypothetical protein
MNLIKSIAEIGVLEVERVVAKFPDNATETSAYLPYVNMAFIENRIRVLANSVLHLGKNTIFLMTPEIALIEELAVLGWNGTTIIPLPFDFDNESVSRIRANIPLGINVHFISEGTFPSDFRPSNGAIICTGLAPPWYRYYIPTSSYRMMTLYKAFHGDRILLSCSPDESEVPELGWTYTEDDFFTNIMPA